MSRRLSMTLGAALFVAAFLPRLASAADDVSFRLDFYAQSQDAANAYGIEKGIYAKHGINLKILEGTGSGPVTQMIAAGTDRFGKADAYTLAKLASTGLPVKMIGSFTQNSIYSIVSFESSNIRSLHDLYGKKVAFATGDAQSQLFPALMNANKLDISKVNIVYLAPQAKQSALIAGSVDAMAGAYTAQSGVIEREAGRKVSDLRYADLGANTIGFGIIVNAKYLGDRSLNCRMVAATSEAFSRAARDPQGATDALMKMFPRVNKGDRALTLEQWKLYTGLMQTENSKGKKLGYMAEKDWDFLVKLGMKYGQFSDKPATDYYTNEFIDCK